ncbi:MAG: hypothetical protein AAF539_16835 [Planctomycetota bacterium]
MTLKRFLQQAGYVAFGMWIAMAAASAQRVAYERPPIDYMHAAVHDPVANLSQKVASGEIELEHDEQFGYLTSVLKHLDIPVSSQTLVFSKTSLQLHRISPRRPRALYFNDDVYVGYCQRGDVLEFAATDRNQGATFYTLSQDKSNSPTFVRDQGACLSCHASSRTQGVPGYLIRSVFPDAAGRPKLGSGTFTIDHTSDFRDRWGGWYVTGQHGAMRHMGNAIAKGDEDTFDREPGANQQNLDEHFRTTAYLTGHSDLVALMVLEHQTQMHNAMAAANYETRLALHQSFQMNKLLDRPEGYVSESAQRRISASAKLVLRYLLFADEFVLTDPVSGSSRFAEDFTARGKKDHLGRSLRDFDLTTRLFRYPCSYLIHSPAFAGLPDPVRVEVIVSLAQILSDPKPSSEYPHLTAAIKSDILQILRDTAPEFRQQHLTSLN